MIELFLNVPQHVRDLAKGWTDLALRQSNPIEAVKMISEFANSCNTEEEKEFVDFYFRLRMEQIKK